MAIPFPKRGYKNPHYKDMVTLCKRLEVGLILVGFTTNGKAQIDIAVNPEPTKSIRKIIKSVWLLFLNIWAEQEVLTLVVSIGEK